MNLKTRIRSTGLRLLTSEHFLERQRAKGRKTRIKEGGQPTVYYFHQVDDPYSHLTVQKLDILRARYQVKFQPYLVGKPPPQYQGSSDHFDTWALRDASLIADDYDTQFPRKAIYPTPQSTNAANAMLATHLDTDAFAEQAVSIGHEVWSGAQLSSSGSAQPALQMGNVLRSRLGHYQGAMFYFEGEWFWGIDRIRTLENRLISEGYGSEDRALCVPQPAPIDTDQIDASNITLEYFPSLRSPYTAVGHERVLDIISRTGVNVHLRPVMPMLMRGIPAPRQKQRYIAIDSGREARREGYSFAKTVDPFGPPVKRAFALYPGAERLGKGMAFVTAYLNCAWYDGVDITRQAGLREVCRRADIDWEELEISKQTAPDWEDVLEDNLQAMLAADLWGVPSFRVSGGKLEDPFVCWGQDRTWKVENEIVKRT
ncbi:MAG: DsbA family protein [Pseudomonadota bacterium]